MQEPTLTPDTQAVLLLCGRFAPREPVQPLEPTEYNAVAEALRQRQLRPADLLDGSFSSTDWITARVEPARAERLLERRMALGLATERWSNGGLWVISRSDDNYPQRLRRRLARSAPPLLWGVGELSIASSDAIAIVGSRDLDEAAARWAEQLASECARQGFTVVSGGARGVDQTAMAAALSAGGRVIAVLPEGLGRPSVASKYREAVIDDRLLLLSPFYPDAGFSVGNAMGRNKVIYGLADAAAIVRADANKGGTWAGAEEELRRREAIPMFVRATEPMPDGNRALVIRGARPFPNEAMGDLHAVLSGSVPNAMPLLIHDGGAPAGVSEPQGSEPAKPGGTNEVAAPTIYEAVLPLVLAAFKEPTTIKGAAAKLDVKDVQLKLWVDRAMGDGRIVKLKGRAARFRSISPDGANALDAKPQHSLFGPKTIE